MAEFEDMMAPDAVAIETMARQTITGLPAEFAGHAAQVAIRVEEYASEEYLDELEIDDALELTGLYEGIPLTEKSVLDQPVGPDTIWLFRRAILDEWAARGDVTLGDLVAHVVVHELAHHFGWSDDDIARVDRWWE